MCINKMQRRAKYEKL